jgi:hypothetical protein
MPCLKLAELLKDERPDLKGEINRHKWFLSQREKRDVGEEYATKDFLDKYLDAFCEGYKVCYCNHVCSARKECVR